MSKPTLYYLLESPPCLTVITVARALGVELELKLVDFEKSEHTSEQYSNKVNPFQTVPALVESDGFALGESRAIAAYLVQSKKPSSSLYPQDLKKRAVVDWMLNIDLGTLFPAITDVLYEIWVSGDIAKDRIPRMETALKKFNDYLARQPGKFVTGENELSLADISIHFHWILIDLIAPELDTSKYHAIRAWDAKVVEAIKPYNADGIFDKANAGTKAFAEQYRKKK